MTSPPTSDEVARNVDAGVDDPNLQGLAIFGGAWDALVDFTGTWTQNNTLQIQTYGDIIDQYFTIGH